MISVIVPAYNCEKYIEGRFGHRLSGAMPVSATRAANSSGKTVVFAGETRSGFPIRMLSLYCYCSCHTMVPWIPEKPLLSRGIYACRRRCCTHQAERKSGEKRKWDFFYFALDILSRTIYFIDKYEF